MTGFGAAEATLGAARVHVELRSVNSRQIDVRTRLARELGDHGLAVEQRVRARIHRGRVEALVRVEGSVVGPVGLDRAKARAAYEALVAFRDDVAPGEHVPLSLLASVPDLFSPLPGPNADAVEAAIGGAVELALERLVASREAEGRALARDLSTRAEAVRATVATLGPRARAAVEAHAARARERLARIVGTAASDPERGRIEQEVALLAERADVSEELTRLAIHLDELGALLAAVEASGRKLDFLLQEVARELSTVGAKSVDAGVSRAVVEARAEIERMREQVQNVE